MRAAFLIEGLAAGGVAAARIKIHSTALCVQETAISAAVYDLALGRLQKHFSAAFASEFSQDGDASDKPCAAALKKTACTYGILSEKQEYVYGIFVRFVKFFRETLFAHEHFFADIFCLCG